MFIRLYIKLRSRILKIAGLPTDLTFKCILQLSAGTALELMIAIETRKGEIGGRELDLLLHRAKIDIVPFDSEQVEIARNAWRRFGKSNHSASLNFGDCFAYALAKISGEPLFFKGNDFNQTDILCIKY